MSASASPCVAKNPMSSLVKPLTRRDSGVDTPHLTRRIMAIAEADRERRAKATALGAQSSIGTQVDVHA